MCAMALKGALNYYVVWFRTFLNHLSTIYLCKEIFSKSSI